MGRWRRLQQMTVCGSRAPLPRPSQARLHFTLSPRSSPASAPTHPLPSLPLPKVFQRQLSKMGLSEALVDEVGQEVRRHQRP